MNIITIQARDGVSGTSKVLPAPIRALLPGSSHLPQPALAADTLLVPDLLLPVPTRRLVVLVPAGEIDENTLARRVWQLANSSGLSVLYLALSPDTDQVSYQRRRLLGLAAQTAFPPVRTDTGVPAGKNWSQSLQQILQPGDLLVCLAADRTSGLFHRQPLAQHLAEGLCVPVYQLGGLQLKPTSSSQYGVKNTLAWVVTLAWIVAFFWLQVGIDRAAMRPQGTVLLCLSVIAELYGILKINEWTR